MQEQDQANQKMNAILHDAYTLKGSQLDQVRHSAQQIKSKNTNFDVA
jgi:hypothetical protein